MRDIRVVDISIIQKPTNARISAGRSTSQATTKKNRSAKEEKGGGRMLRKVLQRARRERRKGGEAKTREGVLLMISPPAVGLGWSKRREGGRETGEEGRNSGRGNKMGFEILLMERK